MLNYFLKKLLQVVLMGTVCLTVLFLFSSAGLVEAQNETPRPTPTNEPDVTPTIPPGPTATPDNGDGAEPPAADAVSGSIQGMVYEDVTGDGRCINTGVEGEGPVEGIPVEFVSSDEQTVITLTSGPDGQFGLFAAGASYWTIRARPGADWVVTSEATLSAPISADNLSVTGINFCIRQAAVAQVILPASGAAQPLPLVWLALVGLLFIGLGLMRYWQEQRSFG
jgi:hypothetical protein